MGRPESAKQLVNAYKKGNYFFVQGVWVVIRAYDDCNLVLRQKKVIESVYPSEQAVSLAVSLIS